MATKTSHPIAVRVDSAIIYINGFVLFLLHDTEHFYKFAIAINLMAVKLLNA